MKNILQLTGFILQNCQKDLISITIGSKGNININKFNKERRSECGGNFGARHNGRG